MNCPHSSNSMYYRNLLTNYKLLLNFHLVYTQCILNIFTLLINNISVIIRILFYHACEYVIYMDKKKKLLNGLLRRWWGADRSDIQLYRHIGFNSESTWEFLKVATTFYHLSKYIKSNFLLSFEDGLFQYIIQRV